MKKRKKKYNPHKHARQMVKGLIIEWEDKDPISHSKSDIAAQKVSHINPIYRLTADKAFAQFGDWITTVQCFHWLLEITVIFDYENGTTQKEVRELEAFIKLDQINDHALEAIKDAMRHGDMNCYRTTQFKITCLDTADRRNAA